MDNQRLLSKTQLRLKAKLARRGTVNGIWERVRSCCPNLPSLKGTTKTHVNQIKGLINQHRSSLMDSNIPGELVEELRDIVGSRVMGGFQKRKQSGKKETQKEVLQLPEPEPGKSLLENSLFSQLLDTPPDLTVG